MSYPTVAAEKALKSAEVSAQAAAGELIRLATLHDFMRDGDAAR